MRRIILFALLGLGSLANAQTNEKLKKKLEKQRVESTTKFDFYERNQILENASTEKNPIKRDSLKKRLELDRSKIAFFVKDQPFLLESYDTDQIKNANADAIQQGTINGLQGSFNGNGINVTVFDGGRAYERHVDFLKQVNDSTVVSRVTNKERANVLYSSHATGVTGMIGGKGHNLSLTRADGTRIPLGSSKGLMPEATFDNYSFSQTVLPGETEVKNVLQKILLSQAPLSNHSYGAPQGWYYTDRGAGLGMYWLGKYDPHTGISRTNEGSYNIVDQLLDDIVYDNPNMIIVKAAGNSFGDGPINGIKNFYFDSSSRSYVEFKDTDALPDTNCSNGYDCIDSGSLSKNIILVGATEKITTNDGRYTQASDVVKASYSSAGPRDDGAIKPDIVGVGSNILYASTSSQGSISWGQGNGTSYSTPQVTGIIGLWTEINRSLFNNEDLHAASAKTLLIHSAQEAGNIGPDVWFGWGFADAKKGAELLVEKNNNTITFEDKELLSNSKNEFIVETDGKQPLKATIAWIDPSAKDLPSDDESYNNRTSRLVNDLDLRIINIKTKEVYEPWKLNINNPLDPATKGDNQVDNVEQALIDNPTAGRYIIQVSHKGNLVDNEGNNAQKQKYTIIATGYNRIVDNKDAHTSEINIYPTLITDSENILVSFEENIDSITIYDMAGRLLKQEEVKSPLHQLNFGSYPKGVYIINVKAGNHSVSKKILKQ